MAMQLGIGHNEKRIQKFWFEENNNSAHYDPRGIIDGGQLRDVQCRYPSIRTLMLERGSFEQGKYEEEKRKRNLKAGRKARYL